MAKVIDALTRHFRGKIGELVFYQVGGETYVRKAPPKQSKRQKQNVSQLKKHSQDKMAMTQKFLKVLTQAIAFGYQEFKVGARRPYHACVSYTKAHCFIPEGDSFKIDPSLFKISRGSLLPPENASVVKMEGGLEFRWNDNSWISSAKPWDKAFIVLYNPTEQKVLWESAGSVREKENHYFELTELQQQEQWHVYIAFSQDIPWGKRTILSDSVYLGFI